MGTGMPRLVFDEWRTPEADGWPPDNEWCLVIWGENHEPPNVFVGGYSEENKNFYANFGLGGAVLDREHVMAWTLLDRHRWEDTSAEDEADLLAYEEAMAEYQRNPVSTPASEFWKELGVDEKLEEAEEEAERNNKWYTAEEVLEAMRESIGGEK